MKTEKTQNQRLVMVAAAMFALAAGIGGSFFYLQNRATAVAATEKKYYTPDGLQRPPGYDPEVEAARTEIAIGRAKELREKFRPWAASHKEIIQRMLSAQPTDEAALQAVFDAIPKSAQTAGISYRDDLKGEPPFSWGFIEKLAQPADYAKQGETLTRSIRQMKNQRLQEFHDYRDMSVTNSVNSGGWGVRLWASGRITRHELTTAPNRISGERGVATIDEEVVPPYDFFQAPVQVETKTTK